MLKREGEEANGGDVKKRKVLDELSEEGPLTQEDVVYYQKEAIFRQLERYKNETYLVKKETRLLNTEFEAYKSRLVLLSSWIDQFITFISALSPSDASSNIDFFLATPSPLENDDYIKQLEAKKEKLGVLLSAISAQVPTELTDNLASITKELQNVKAKYQSLKSDHNIITTKYNTISEDYNKLLRDHQRLQSKTIPRVLGSTEEKPSTERPSSSTPAATDKEVVTSDNAKPDLIDEEKAHALQSEIAQYKAVIEAQKTTIAENIARFQTLSTQLGGSAVTAVTTEAITTSQLYKTLQSQLLEHQAKNAEYIQSIESIENELKDAKDQITSRDEALKAFTEAKDKLETSFRETKEKEERLRNERDLFISKYEVLKQQNSLKTLADLQDFVKAQEAQLKSYDFSEKLNEIIPSELNDVETLQKKNALLLSEIKELEAAFKQLQSVRLPKVLGAVEEEKRRKELEAAKMKVDQKYRTFMQGEQYQKMNVEKLETTFKVLKTNFEKMESSQGEYKKQIEQLTSELVVMRKAILLKEKEAKEYSKKCDTLNDTLTQDAQTLAQVQQDFATLKNSYEEVLNKESNEAQEIASLKSKIASQDKLIARYKSTGSVEDSSEIDSFRSLIYCSLCSKNWKNTAIKSCGHVFCDACAQERLAARMRKCPSCNKQFSSNDLLTIHL